jgi:hypothetical protein
VCIEIAYVLASLHRTQAKNAFSAVILVLEASSGASDKKRTLAVADAVAGQAGVASTRRRHEASATAR